jgi:hypothetical protein
MEASRLSPTSMRPLLSLLLAAAFTCGPALAQDSLPTVEVKAAHRPLAPYKELFYPMAKAVRQELKGRATLAVQLRAARAGVRTDDLSVWLEGGGESLPLRPSEHGLYVVPVEDRIAQHDGSFSINKNPKDVRANLVLVPTLAPDAWTIGEVQRLLRDVHATMAPLVPWHHRLLSWTFARRLGVSVCSGSPLAQVEVRDGGQVLARFPTSEPGRNHANAPVYCHRFTGKEDFDPRARLVLPDDAQVLLI